MKFIELLKLRKKLGIKKRTRKTKMICPDCGNILLVKLNVEFCSNKKCNYEVISEIIPVYT